MFEFISFEANGTPIEIRRPYTGGRASAERKLAEKVMHAVGSARFSPSTFGQYLRKMAANSNEIDDMLLAAIYFIAAVAYEDDYIDVEAKSRTYMAKRILDVLTEYGYTR